MEFWMQEQHKILRYGIRRFIANEIIPYIEDWDKQGFTPRSVFEKMGQLGYLGLIYPEEYGGQGGDIFSGVVLAEELGRSTSLGVANTISVDAFTAPQIILEHGTEEQKRNYLEPTIKGTKIAAVAITEPDAGSDISMIKTSAIRSGEQWIINGSKMFVTNGSQADFIVSVVRTGPGNGSKGLSILIVDRDAPGLSVSRRLQKVGTHAADAAEIVFQDCIVPLDRLVGEQGQGFGQLMRGLQLDRLMVAAEALAAGELSLELAVNYCQQRQQFGQPLIRFQALQHRIADLFTALEAGKQLLYSAAWKYDRGLYPVKEIAMAKLFGVNAAYKAADYAMQLHGGYAYTTEYPVQRLWRDLRHSRFGGGTDEIMREIVAREMELVPKEKR